MTPPPSEAPLPPTTAHPARNVSVTAPEPILVVGAGPTGLTLALILTRYGVPVRIVERKPALSQHTKATNVMQRNQELIAALGLLPQLAAVSGVMSSLVLNAYGADLGPRSMHLDDSPHHDILLCGQDRFEAVLARGLADLGVTIEFATELTGLRQDRTGVTATLLHRGGAEQVRFGWVAGCDGATGTSRRFTAHDFVPRRTGVAIRQVDATLAWRRSPTAEQMWLFYVDRGFAVVVPLPGGVHRVLSIEPRGAMPEREPTLAEMETRLREVSGDDSLTLSDERWASYTDLAMGLAPGLRDGRVFLVGDVANPILPNGGQGMNTGIADAYDLGWKLVAVLAHGAPDALLDTYQEERLALRTALQKVQYATLKYTALRTPALMRAAFRALAAALLDHGGERRMALAFSELSLNTRRSPLTLENGGRGGIRAGDRAADAPLTTTGHPGHLYDLLYRGGWTLLAFTGRGSGADAGALIGALTRLLRPDLATFTVAAVPVAPRPDPGGSGANGTTADDILWDLDGGIHRRYGLRTPMLVLVRPDGHLALRVPVAKVHQLRDYLTRWVPDASQHFTTPSTAEPVLRNPSDA